MLEEWTLEWRRGGVLNAHSMNPVEGGDSWHLAAERRLEDTKAGVF